MAKKAVAPKKKVGATKAAAPARATRTKRVSKGESMVCGVCGLSVVVEEVGGLAVAKETALLCCDTPMKERASRPKAAKK